MAKVPTKGVKEDFGESGIHQMQSPLSFQLNGHGTPEHICDLLPEYDDEPPKSGHIKDPAGFTGIAGREK